MNKKNVNYLHIIITILMFYSLGRKRTLNFKEEENCLSRFY